MLLKLTEKRKLHTLISTRSLIAVLLLVISSCAKELPVQESDDIKDTVFKISLFDKEMKVEVDNSNIQEQLSEISSIYALEEETSSLKTNVKEGHKDLRPFFKDLTLERSLSGKQLQVSFKLTKNYLVAFISNGDLNQTPLFQYPISAYGKKRRSKNSLGEETRSIEFITTDKEEATHVKVPVLAKKRILAGLRSLGADDQKNIFSKNKIETRTWNLTQLHHLTKSNSNQLVSEVSGKLLKENEKYKVLTFKNELYLYTIVPLSKLVSAEEAILKLKLQTKLLRKCDAHTADAVKIEQNKCFLRAEYHLPIKNIKLSQNKDEDEQELATSKIEEEVNTHIAKLIQIVPTRLESTAGMLDSFVSNLGIDDNILLSKAEDLDLSAEYLYVPSTQNTPKDVAAADAFFQGTEKIVKIKITKDGLEVYEEEKDERFTRNEYNHAPVLTLPGKHIDYKCIDSNNEVCTNGIVEDNEEHWNSKKYFIPEINNLEIHEVNTLNLFTVSDGCIKETDSKATGYEITNGVINIEVEKTFQVSAQSRCMVRLFYSDNLRSASFKVKYFYSMVRLKDLASDNYEVVDYPEKDHNKFGFFKNQETKLSVDFDRSRMIEKYTLNRFNPKKDTIKYHLSKTFGYPENTFLKKATEEVIVKLNKSLNKANANIQIKLIEPPKEDEDDIKSGDLRINSIVLIDDPLANGLLGYGPSVTNPRTGEIVQAHTNMYSGVLRSMTRHVYNQMVNLSSELLTSTNEVESTNLSFEVNQSFTPSHLSYHAQKNNSLLQTISSDIKINLEENLSEVNQSKIIRSTQQEDNPIAEKFEAYDFMNTDDQVSSHEHFDHINRGTINNIINKHNGYESMLDNYAKHNAFHKDFYQLKAHGKRYIDGILEIEGILNDDKTLKKWDELKDDQRKQASDLIVRHAYMTTLTHELGHNLGLRHNFEGSVDQKNFYSKDEAKKEGLTNIPQYSSIMDYGKSELNELQILGKYDLAALRFGYAREVETSTPGEFKKVSSSIKDLIQNSAITLKEYKFCTDQHVYTSATCNRFDDGTSLTEITQNYVNSYYENYKLRNFRNGRNEFSKYGIGGYVAARSSEFKRIYKSFTEFKILASIVGQELMEQGCPPEAVSKYPFCTYINDRRDAMKVAANFFVDVLKTPNKTCAIFDTTKSIPTVSYKTFSEIYSKLRSSSDNSVITSCFDKQLESIFKDENLVLVGEVGKPFASYNGHDQNHQYSGDIEVRGIWPDKLLAMQFLTSRNIQEGIKVTSKLSIADLAEYRPKVMNFINNLTLGEPIDTPHNVVDKNGKDIFPFQGNSNFVIQPQPHWYPIVAFKLPISDPILLNKVILQTALSANNSTDPTIQSKQKSMENYLKVIKKNVIDGISNRNINRVEINDTLYASTEKNGIAGTAINSINDELYLRNLVLPQYFNFPNCQNLTQEPSCQKDKKGLIKYILEKRINPELPSSLTEDEQKIIKVEIQLLELLQQVMTKGIVLSLEKLETAFGPEIGKILFTAYGLGLEKLNELISIKQNLGAAPDNASGIVKRIYSLPLPTLNFYLKGQLERVNEHMKNTLLLLPHSNYNSEWMLMLNNTFGI
jgi:hypothetical protein